MAICGSPFWRQRASPARSGERISSAFGLCYASAAVRHWFRHSGCIGSVRTKSSPVSPPPSPFLIDVRGGAARAPGAGVGGQRSHGRRSAADFRVSERPWRAAANVRRWGMGSPGPGVTLTSVAPPAAGRQKSRRMRSSSVRRPLRLRPPICSSRSDFRGAPGCGTAQVSSLGRSGSLRTKSSPTPPPPSVIEHVGVRLSRPRSSPSAAGRRETL